jgi:hypothetical protein
MGAAYLCADGCVWGSLWSSLHPAQLQDHSVEEVRFVSSRMLGIVLVCVFEGWGWREGEGEEGPTMPVLMCTDFLCECCCGSY